MPWLSYHVSVEDTVRNGATLVRAGAEAVKLEGGLARIPMIEALLTAEIPVMGHLGLTPQWVRGLGGFKVQARDAASAGQLREDASALEQAGAFALVLECIPADLAREVTSMLRVPTIGIGAGAGCDGQVLVLQDLLGLNPDFKPRFARRFADGAALVRAGASKFADSVRRGDFPADGEGF
jgi:3-methyl-2-oxobutanoate hydroxymethyltransferase